MKNNGKISIKIEYKIGNTRLAYSTNLYIDLVPQTVNELEKKYIILNNSALEQVAAFEKITENQKTVMGDLHKSVNTELSRNSEVKHFQA